MKNLGGHLLHIEEKYSFKDLETKLTAEEARYVKTSGGANTKQDNINEANEYRHNTLEGKLRDTLRKIQVPGEDWKLRFAKVYCKAIASPLSKKVLVVNRS